MTDETSKNPPLPEEDVAFGGLNQLTRSLREADDRGLILSLSAFAEEALGDLLGAFMLPCEASTQLLSGFNAPLGTFSSRIKAAYAFGLVTKEQFQDLERLRKIRNEFAHTWKPIDLSHPKAHAAAEGMNFSGIDQKYPKTAKDKVRSSITCLLIELRVAADKLRESGNRAKSQGSHLVAGFSGIAFSELITSARKNFEEIKVGLASPSRDEKAFYIKQILKLPERLALIKPTTSEEKSTLIEILSEVHSEIKQCQA